MSNVTHVEIRMYRLGTGDCFALKFFSKNKEKPSFKMLIDAGAWSGTKDKISPYINNLKEYLGGFVDVLVVTHEHKDHVHAFDVCEELFTADDFSVGEIWFGWTENDKIKKVKEWKESYGEKKKALGIVANELKKAVKSNDFIKQYTGNKNATSSLKAMGRFSNILNGFASLHLSNVQGEYKGSLAGMEVVKTKIKKNDVKYFLPGDVLSDYSGADGIKFYVLGPPKLYDEINTETGGEGESYKHNKILKGSDEFSAAILDINKTTSKDNILPFDDFFVENDITNKSKIEYDNDDWRKIDFDWLNTAGSFALRMNSLTNNLSLALAIEFESGKVMLFPGDAEYGSWASWHNIKWDEEGKDGKHFTEDLLNRVVFYKVAHHLSHNGTAQKLGLEMMTSKELSAMATLDYDVINDGWKSTMPNRSIINELLLRTKGRLMIMKEKGLYYDFNEEVPMSEKVKEARNRMTAKEKKEFQASLEEDPLFIQFTVQG